MSVYAAFGYSLPRVACDQVNTGVEVDMSDLQPGDIIGYGGSYIGHVGIYIGGGQIVHAASSTQGIITQNYDYHTPTKAVRIVNNYISQKLTMNNLLTNQNLKNNQNK